MQALILMDNDQHTTGGNHPSWVSEQHWRGGAGGKWLVGVGGWWKNIITTIIHIFFFIKTWFCVIRDKTSSLMSKKGQPCPFGRGGSYPGNRNSKQFSDALASLRSLLESRSLKFLRLLWLEPNIASYCLNIFNRQCSVNIVNSVNIINIVNIVNSVNIVNIANSVK